MESVNVSANDVVTLETVLSTADLRRRRSRPPNHAAENRAMVALAHALAASPNDVLKRLAETALDLCDAQSAGVSLLEADGKHFYWPALVGQWADHVGGGTPREFGPCGTVLDRNAPLLMSHPERHFPYLADVTPLIEEVLLIPFYLEGKAVGTVWVIAHDETHSFDGEDLRVMTNLSKFAAVAHKVLKDQQALRKSERRIREILDELPAAIYTTDPAGRLTHVNPAVTKLAGCPPELGADQTCLSRMLYRPDGTPLPHDLCPMVVALKEGRPVRGEEIIVERPDGARVWIEPYSTPLFDDADRVIGGIHMLVDISESKQKRLAQAWLSAIVNSTDDAVIGKDLNGIITSWNHGAERLFGYTAREAIGQPVTMIIPPDRLNEESVILDRLRRGDRVDHFETVRLRKDGHRIDLSLTVSPVKDAEGRIVGASKIARDITLRKQLDGMQKQMDRRKDEFLATLSHELRNPLTPIRNSLEILKRAEDDACLVEEARATMERQIEQMTRLVDDLFDASRITRGNLELRKQRIELASVIRQVVEACRLRADCSGHQLNVAVPREPIYLIADPVRLTQVFDNLLTNACKYTDLGGRIDVTVEQRGSAALVSVRDTGIGIPREMLSAVFEMFTQVDRSLERSQSGLGIGLTLVKRLIEMHGGQVTAHSEGPGRGSEFVVRLPVHSAPLAEKQPEPTPDDILTRARRILVVDDNRDSATSLARLLKLKGHETQTAHDGLQAVEKAAEHRPEVILLDIGLPKMNGYDACRAIRRQPWGKHVFIVALTGWGQEEDRHKSTEAGFDAHLVKPVELTTLSKLLTESQPRPA